MTYAVNSSKSQTIEDEIKGLEVRLQDAKARLNGRHAAEALSRVLKSNGKKDIQPIDTLISSLMYLQDLLIPHPTTSSFYSLIPPSH